MRTSMRDVFISTILWANMVQGQVYYIDPDSCNADEIIFVQKALTGAFAMAQSGFSALLSTRNTDQQNELTTWLLGSLQTGDTYIGRMFSRSGGVLRFNNPAVSPILTKNDVKIYCNQRRLIKRTTDIFHLFDTDNDQAMPISDRMACLTTTLAYTITPVDDPDRVPKAWYQLQLCPWFVKYGMTVTYPTTADVPATLWQSSRVKIVPWTAKLLYVPIDVFALSDKVLLHEMTHASRDLTLQTEDAGPFSWSGYGWKNCRGLSTNPARPPQRNADTWALYGTASLINENGGQVTIDGQFGG